MDGAYHVNNYHLFKADGRGRARCPRTSVCPLTEIADSAVLWWRVHRDGGIAGMGCCSIYVYKHSGRFEFVLLIRRGRLTRGTVI